MAPLGIITIIVGAIRIGGPMWMRALIGRARENRTSAELDLLSSTSQEVGELWTGEAIVRSTGQPDVKQIVLIRKEWDDEDKKWDDEENKVWDFNLENETFGLYTLETAYKEKDEQGNRKMTWKGEN